MKEARIISKHRPGSTMLELREGREGAGGKIYSAGVASDSDDERLKIIERLMEVARERKIERLFLAPVGSTGDDLESDAEYRLCPQANVICPGPIQTEMLHQSAVRDFVIRNSADLMEPADVAGAALFLASDLFGGMNSQVLVVRTKSRW